MPSDRISDVLIRHNVTVQGRHGQPVLLYAHGFGCNQDMWRSITPHFEETHRQILFDYLGNSRTGSEGFDEKRYSDLSGYASDMIEICAALGLTSGVNLVAHSVSCSIGMLASIMAPGLFNSMVMIGPSPSFLNHPPDYNGGFEPADLEGLMDLMAQNYIGWADYLAPIAAGSDALDNTAAQLRTSFCSTDPNTARVFARATFFADNRAELPRVTTPTLLLQHSDDSLVPISVGHYMAERMPDARLSVLPVSGHCAHMSNPDLVISAMRASGLPAYSGTDGVVAS